MDTGLTLARDAATPFLRSGRPWSRTSPRSLPSSRDARRHVRPVSAITDFGGKGEVRTGPRGGVELTGAHEFDT